MSEKPKYPLTEELPKIAKNAELLLETYQNSIKYINEHLKITSARIDIILFSSSAAAIYYLMKPIPEKIDIAVWLTVFDLSLFGGVCIFNLLFLIIGQVVQARTIKVMSSNIVKISICRDDGFPNYYEVIKNLDTDLKDISTQNIPEDELQTIGWIKRTQRHIIIHNLYYQFAIWGIAILILILISLLKF